jgi:heme/copper-type cytochrome/quinol oxidase subunit 3
MNVRPSIDVSALQPATMDHRSPIWWGNLLMIVIETTAFALLVGAYFYLRGNFSQWPPPQSNAPLGLFDPVPALLLPTINLAVILLSCVPMLVADRAALRLNRSVVEWALGLTIVVSLVAVGLRFVEFRSLKFRWDDNAYGSVTWTILGMHLLHLIIGTLENVTMFTWLLVHGLDEKHARDIHVTAIYWYWVAAVWVVLFAIVFPGPRFF